ncbi:MAG: hypothetical protein U9R19_11370 [Bacteroidota bacterium]|nr:hypothetical protein [Bacteroidota bacterium]
MCKEELPDIDNKEYLYRGIIEKFWDYENNKPSSAIYKDSKGVSVDRDYNRNESDCIKKLIESKDFFAVCKIKKEKVVDNNAVVKYLPIDNNIYHSEIHDSEVKIQLKGSKPKKLRDNSFVVHKRELL